MKIIKEMLDILSLPEKIVYELEKYMTYRKKPGPYVMQEHLIGKSQHLDFRMKMNGYLEGWSIVGGNIENPITPQRLLRERAKGFRAETKAKQPISWLKVEGEIKPGEVGAAVEKPGRFTILSKGQFITGTQKPYFHEYFIKGKHFPNWTRIVVRAVKVKKLDPRTKRPIPGRIERLWRIMIPKDQEPYTISNRAISRKWKPPKDIKPFPEEWTKKNYPEQYNKWLKYMKSKELSEQLRNIKFTLVLTSWMGPRAKTGRRMPKYKWYLLLDDKGKGSVRTFYLDGYPIKETIMSAYEEERSNRKWLIYTGNTKPNTRFNPNKEIQGKYTIMDKGIVGYNREIKNGKEQILFNFKGKILKGKWSLLQEEKEADFYTFEKIGKEKLELSKGKFVLDRHEFPINNGIHIDLRWYINRLPFDEINLFDSPINKKEGETIKAIKKTCKDLEWMKIKPKGTKMKSYGKLGKVDTIDHGRIEIIEDNPSFISMNIRGKYLKGYYILKKENKLWSFSKSSIAKPEKDSLQKEGDPRIGPYKDFIVEDIKGRDYFTIRLYDLRKFTKIEPKDKIKKYLDIDIPSGIDIGIGLYPRAGKIHGAKIVYVNFDRNKYSPEEGEKWIRNKKLHVWEGIQIREKKELVEDQFRIWIKVNKIDIPGREIHCDILTPTGKKEAIFGVFEDDIIQDMLEKYRKGENIFLVRIFRRFIIQVISSSKMKKGPLYNKV